MYTYALSRARVRCSTACVWSLCVQRVVIDCDRLMRTATYAASLYGGMEEKRSYRRVTAV